MRGQRHAEREPEKIRTGNWSNPAPPPEKAENRLAISETRKSRSWSMGVLYGQIDYSLGGFPV